MCGSQKKGQPREAALSFATLANPAEVTPVSYTHLDVYKRQVLGLGAALGTCRLLKSLLFQVGPYDPWTYAGAAMLLVVVALAAALVPARAAMRVEPVAVSYTHLDVYKRQLISWWRCCWHSSHLSLPLSLRERQ